MSRILILIIVILCFSSCNNKEKNRNLMCCQSEIKIEEYPDPSLLSNTTCMTCYKNKIYVLDKKRGDIVVLGDNLKEMEYVSKHDEAPYEITWPFTFNVLSSTVYAVDFGTKLMKKFHGGVFYGDFSLSNTNENRFSLNDSLIFLSANTGSTSSLVIGKYHSNGQVPMGEVIREKTPFRTIISNEKYILYDQGEGIFSISGCYPCIEQYNIRGEYIKASDISSIPIIKETTKAAKKDSSKEKSVYIHIRDTYLVNDHIYILCSPRSSSGDYRANTILKLLINDEMKHISIYILPHDIYPSSCVSDTYLLTSQEVAGVTIKKIKIGDAKK